MLSRFLIFLIGDLVCSKVDKSLSLTRLAAATAHASAALFFIIYNFTEPFNWDLWVIYLGFATGHAIWDKSWMTTKGKTNESP